MNLYIETENGVAKNHPAPESNLMEIFGKIPEHWEPFVRANRPVPTVYQVVDRKEPTYQKINGVWTDVWPLRDMTTEEKAVRQQEVKDSWAKLPDRDNFTAWTFDELTCSYQPPVPPPADGKNYYWRGATNSWNEAPPYPQDGKQYQFDFLTWNWVEVTA